MRCLLPESHTCRRLGAYVLLIGVIVVSSSCGMVSYGIPQRVLIDAPDFWCELKAPYPPPMNRSDDAVVQAAISRKIAKNSEITAICLAANENEQLVVTVSELSKSSDPFSPKNITYYRVTDGAIRAISKTVQGPSPDIDYEQTIFNAAQKSKATRNKAIIIYSRSDKNLTVVGNADGCMAEVSVILDFEPYREPVSVRLVPICSK
jgi:hypothetical protein